MPMPPIGVMPGVIPYPLIGVAPTIGVAPWTGVSSHRFFFLRGVGAAPPKPDSDPAKGVIPGVIPGVRPGVASTESQRELF